MVILKKVKSSTLMETLVATVLVVIVFMLASMILNNLFSTTINNNTQVIDTHLNELQYLLQNDKIELPYTETFQNWNVTIENYQDNNQAVTEFEVIHLKTNKTISFIQNAN
ncbi:hypothetical protein [Lacinutrix sp.]|uniref:PulJ/GspJ family protein n=1 Tax=Lacinutrix sp. TaxID=1937692 RepID=UPI0025BE0902|nr:hypothetical protein [Lacinutrix sp.]